MIQTSNTHALTRKHAARLGPNHGYRIEGDIALLHADVAVDIDLDLRHSQWALQLWACDTPFAGGSLSGVKIAEATLPLPDHAAQPQRMDAEALASLPAGQRDYSMVLVLASGAPGAFDQIHDFANYPARERFISPHLEGGVGYHVDGDQVVLRAGGIRNPRNAGNLSGSLALELWALPEAYDGSPTFEGTLLANADAGRIAGEQSLQAFEQRVHFTAPPAGAWQVVLMLREWVVGGYVTRDYCTFAQPYRVSAPAKAAEPAKTIELVKAVESATLVEPATLAEPATLGEPANAVEPAKLDEPAKLAEPVTLVEPANAVEPAKLDELAKLDEPEPAAKRATSSVIPQTSAVSHINGTKSPQPIVRWPDYERDVSATTPGGAVSPIRRDARVSIMHASVEEIAALKGLTKKIAQEIVRGRPYTNLDELVRVRGIGPKLLGKLRNFLTL